MVLASWTSFLKFDRSLYQDHLQKRGSGFFFLSHLVLYLTIQHYLFLSWASFLNFFEMTTLEDQASAPPPGPSPSWKSHFPEGDLWVFGYGYVTSQKVFYFILVPKFSQEFDMETSTALWYSAPPPPPPRGFRYSSALRMGQHFIYQGLFLKASWI